MHIRELESQKQLKFNFKFKLTLIMTSRRAKIQEDTYCRVLRILQEKPDVTQREIAKMLGLSTSGINYCLNALIDKGWVKVSNFSGSKNKLGYVYLLTPNGILEKATLTKLFLQRKLMEYEEMRTEIDFLISEVSKVSEVSEVIEVIEVIEVSQVLNN